MRRAGQVSQPFVDTCARNPRPVRICLRLRSIPFDGNHQRARVALAAWSRRHTGPCTPSDARAVETDVKTIMAVRNRPSCAPQNAAVQAAQVRWSVVEARDHLALHVVGDHVLGRAGVVGEPKDLGDLGGPPVRAVLLAAVLAPSGRRARPFAPRSGGAGTASRACVRRGRAPCPHRRAPRRRQSPSSG